MDSSETGLLEVTGQTELDSGHGVECQQMARLAGVGIMTGQTRQLLPNELRSHLGVPLALDQSADRMPWHRVVQRLAGTQIDGLERLEPRAADLKAAGQADRPLQLEQT